MKPERDRENHIVHGSEGRLPWPDDPQQDSMALRTIPSRAERDAHFSPPEPQHTGKEATQMEEYEKPRMEIIEIEAEVATRCLCYHFDSVIIS